MTSYEDTKAMEAILSRLNGAVEATSKKIVTESKTNDELRVAMATTREQDTVRVCNYEIVTEKFNVNGFKKNYYTVTEGNEVLYKQLSLFESAMSIVKRLMLNKRTIDCDKIAKLDESYDNHLQEAYGYKYRMKRINESVKRDVYEAKYTNALGKMKNAKEKIVKTL